MLSLTSLSPLTVTQAAILQASAKYIRQLQSVRDRLMIENRMLRGKLGEPSLDDCMVSLGGVDVGADQQASGRRRAESGVSCDSSSGDDEAMSVEAAAAAVVAATGTSSVLSTGGRRKIQVTVSAEPAAEEQTNTNLHTIIQAMRHLEGDAFSPAATPRRPRSPTANVDEGLAVASSTEVSA